MKNEKVINELAARVQALEKQQQQGSMMMGEGEGGIAQQRSKGPHQPIISGPGIYYGGTWRVELREDSHVYASPTFNVGGFDFRLILTQKTEQGEVDECRFTGVGNCTMEGRMARRTLGLFLEYLPTVNGRDARGIASAIPCVQCWFQRIDEEDGERVEDGTGQDAEREGKNQTKTLGGSEWREERATGRSATGRVYESSPTYLETAGWALGVENFTRASVVTPRPLASRGDEGEVEEATRVFLIFRVMLPNVHFMGAREEARVADRMWKHMESVVEGEFGVTGGDEEMMDWKGGGWKEDSRLFVAREETILEAKDGVENEERREMGGE